MYHVKGILMARKAWIWVLLPAFVWGCGSTPADDAPPLIDVVVEDSLSVDTGVDTGPTFDTEAISDGSEVTTSDLGTEADVGQDITMDVDLSDLPDVAPTCEAGQGCFLDPCASDDECFSGLCVLHLGEKVCTELCTDECAAGWSCGLQAGLSVCRSNFARLCMPCDGPGDCSIQAGDADCVPHASGGSFCGASCETNEGCPEGYICEEQLGLGGQCVPSEGDCACSSEALVQQLQTTCSLSNDFGTCNGLRVCAEDGLTQCDAALPVEEVCNALDDDCDGVTDELVDVLGVAHNAGCDVNATCTATEGSAQCQCNPGFAGDGFNCVDVDECASGEAGCDEHATCTNSVGAFECACNPGFEGDGQACLDLDECILGSHDCHDEATCSNTEGSFSCSCNSGYEGDGTSCADVNECLTGDAGCDENASCTNLMGDFSCACNSGFAGDGFDCSDEDECSNGSVNQQARFESHTLITPDGKSLNAELHLPAGPGPYPVILLIHQFTMDLHQWDPYLSDLHDLGFATFALEMRGHGSSDPYDGNFFDMITDPDAGPVDVQTALDFLLADSRLDHQRIGAVGTSIGANIVYVLAEGEASSLRAGVALSPRDVALFSMLGVADSEELSFTPVFCLAGENDSLGIQADTCLELQPLCQQPNTVQIVEDSGEHGYALITEYPEVWPAIVTYLNDVVLSGWVAPSGHNCHGDATCTNSVGSFTCACNPGFEGEGLECLEIDECATAPCGDGGTCADLVDAYSCACAPEFSGGGVNTPCVCEPVTTCEPWSECSVECGVGVQTRSCNDGCGGTTWSESQACNPSCAVCNTCSSGACVLEVAGSSCGDTSKCDGSGACIELPEPKICGHDPINGEFGAIARSRLSQLQAACAAHCGPAFTASVDCSDPTNFGHNDFSTQNINFGDCSAGSFIEGPPNEGCVWGTSCWEDDEEESGWTCAPTKTVTCSCL